MISNKFFVKEIEYEDTKDFILNKHYVLGEKIKFKIINKNTGEVFLSKNSKNTPTSKRSESGRSSRISIDIFIILCYSIF